MKWQQPFEYLGVEWIKTRSVGFMSQIYDITSASFRLWYYRYLEGLVSRVKLCSLSEVKMPKCLNFNPHVNTGDSAWFPVLKQVGLRITKANIGATKVSIYLHFRHFANTFGQNILIQLIFFTKN